jgi:hypothetical protein
MAMKIKSITLAARQRTCPKCKERCYYDLRRDFVDADHSDEEWVFRECRLCGYKDPVKPKRNTKKQQAKKKRQAELEELMQSLLKEER